MQICPDFLKGKCALGVYCRLEHPTSHLPVSRPSHRATNGNGNDNRAPIRHSRFHIGECRHCHRESRLATCQKCHKVGYCSNECRVANLDKHRRSCLEASGKAASCRDLPEPTFVNPNAPVPRPPQPQDVVKESMSSDEGTTPATRETRDRTVFENHHAYAPRALKTKVGMPFKELQNRSWLVVRRDPEDVHKLLSDAFRLRKFDNRRYGGKDALVTNRGGGSSYEAQWNEFVNLCQRNRLLPSSMDSEQVKSLAQTMMLGRDELEADEVVKLSDDVRMPLQMRIFAEQVMGYAMVTVSGEMWADLLKFEQWEWAGSGFEWKVVFGQK